MRLSPEMLALLALYGHFLAGLSLATVLLMGWILISVRQFVPSSAASPVLANSLRPARSWHTVQMTLILLAFSALTGSLLLRAVAVGRAPYSNQYEFAVVFAWGVLLLYLLLAQRHREPALAAGALVVALGLLLYASTIPSAVTPQPPALQNSLLLTLHVGCAVVAYAANAVAFIAGALFLVQRLAYRWRGQPLSGLPSTPLLDELGYRSVMVSFPMLGAVLLLGSWWSAIAWGSYWNWDPKQSATLGVWLLYAAYLHTRVLREWQGTGGALLLVLGFAATLLTYLGNLFFSGLHSYAGV